MGKEAPLSQRVCQPEHVAAVDTEQRREILERHRFL